MKLNPNDPANPILFELDQHLRSIKILLNQLEPAQRLLYVNELMVRLLPSRSNIESSQERLMQSHKNPTTLSNQERKIIEKLARSTENLFRSQQEED